MTQTAGGRAGIVHIGQRLVGRDQPCFVIAEAGSNHNGSLDQALRLIDVASEAKADAVKFQLFTARHMYPRNAGTSEYLRLSTPIYDIIEAAEMPHSWLPRLANHCAGRGIMFLASVFDEASADAVDPYVEAFKIASYEMNHMPLVRYVCGKKKPVIISTGTANLDEVDETVRVCRETGNDGLVLLQCTAAYPAPVEALNIRAMDVMARGFGVPVGLSDHSRDPIVGPVTAVACGAAVIEKHFTLDNDLPGPDHRFALEPAELSVMVRKIREAEAALGRSEKVVAPVEQELRAFARRSIFALRDIPAGSAFTKENVAVLRCGRNPPGLPPRAYSGLLGRKAARALPGETTIQPGDVALD